MNDLLDLTKTLIRFKSMLSRPDEIYRCVEFIERFLKDAGATCKRIECDGVPSIAALPGPDFAPVLLMSAPGGTVHISRRAEYFPALFSDGLTEIVMMLRKRGGSGESTQHTI